MANPRETVSSGEGRTILERLGDPKATRALPSLGALVKQLEGALGEKNVAIDEISRLVGADQSMALRVMRMANSAYYAPAQPILELDDAILYLGMSNVRSIILTAQYIERACDIPEDLFPWKQFWLHAVGVGVLARVLGSYLRPEWSSLTGDSFYVMGLFHDIGKLVLAYVAPKDFERVIRQAKHRRCPTGTVEQELLGVDHAMLGTWYLQQQGMPLTISEPVGLHHAWKLDRKHNCNAVLVSLADRLAHRGGSGESGSYWDPADDPFQTDEWRLCVDEFWEIGRGNDEYVARVTHELEALPDLVAQLVS